MGVRELRLVVALVLTAVALHAAGAPERVDVIVPIVFGAEPYRELPQVTLTDADGLEHMPATPLRAGERHVVFCEIPRGTLTATLSGKRWKTVTATIEPPADAATFVAAKLDAIPTTKLIVHWWTMRDLASLVPRKHDCGAEEEGDEKKETRFVASIAHCPGERAAFDRGHYHRAKCTLFAEQELPLDAIRGEAVFEDIPAGLHVLEIHYPGLPRLSRAVEVFGKESNDFDMELRWFTFYGKVTRGGEPLHAQVWDTVTDPETGHYSAVFRRDPKTNTSSVVTCDDSLVWLFIPDPPPVENAAYDIEIPDNKVVIDVVDADSRQPVENADVHYSALIDGEKDAAHFGGAPAGKTDAEGRVVIAPVLMNKRLGICASRDDYESRCSEHFVMKDAREKRIELALAKVVLRHGRIVPGGPFRMGRLVWVNAAGQFTEHITRFDDEGRFTYKKAHAEGETAVFSASNRPLYAFRQPRLAEGEELVIRMPNAPVRSFDVKLAEGSRDKGPLALRIGDAIVSINILSWHHDFRDSDTSLDPGQTARILDIYATGPIRVILVPWEIVERYSPQNIEPPFVPELGSLPQQDLGEREAIVFP